MKRNEKSKLLDMLVKEVSKNKYNFNSPLQRKSGQWNRMQKSELIDSILREDPIPPVLIAENNDGTLDIIDGIQRISTITDFFNNVFSLSRNMDGVTVDGAFYDVAGKKYKSLPDEVKDKLRSSSIRVDLISGYDENDIRRIFKRTNNGTPFKPSQKLTVYESIEFSALVHRLSNHDFITNNLSEALIKKDVDKDIIRQILMLCTDYQVNSFRVGDIKKFIDACEISTDDVDTIIDAMDNLNDMIQGCGIINKTVFSFIVYGMTKTKNPEQYVEWVKNDIILNFSNNNELKQYCLSGTANKENVLGRLEYFNKHI